MPIHDWTKVNAGTFHDFHSVWIAFLRNALNQGLLPSSYYAQAEQVAGDIGPDVIALQIESANGDVPEAEGLEGGTGAVAVATAPPRVRFAAKTEKELYVEKQKHLVIRHVSGDRVVAIIEILSPGNKETQVHFDQFLTKAKQALCQGIHLLIIDLFPPTVRDPQGIHGLLWSYLCDDSYRQPSDKPLTLASYSAGLIKEAYVEPVEVGDILIDMPLFLHPGWYVQVPLEKTYQEAWEGMPRKYQRILTA